MRRSHPPGHSQCEWFLSRIDDFGAGRLDEVDFTDAETHLLDCPRCLDAWSAWIGEAPDLARSVLEEAGLDPCRQALTEIADSDKTLSAADNPELAEHLEFCPPCSAVALALEELKKELPKLRNVEPDKRFVSDVVAMTSGSAAKESVWQRFRDRCVEMTRRPRFALETAYVVASLLLVFFGLDSFSAPAVQETFAKAETLRSAVAEITTRADHHVENVGGHLLHGVDGSLEKATRRYQQAMNGMSELELKLPSFSDFSLPERRGPEARDRDDT
jgi:thiol-disulfide isomerase/thioredoxin